MTEDGATLPEAEAADPPAPRGGDVVYRHRRPLRVWHWVNALTVFIMLMSGMMIFNAHPRLYWGQYGANFDYSWLQIGSMGDRGYLRIGSLVIPTTGVLGVVKGQHYAFPALVTIPSSYDLAGARRWHFFFAWFLVFSIISYWFWSVGSRHLRRVLAPRRHELRPTEIGRDVLNHLRLRFPTGAAALDYNVLQKLAYLSVVLVLIPLVILTGLTMSPGMDAGWPWLLWVFGGRASARSIHFLAATGLAFFIAVHVVMVVLAGPWNEVRSMVTGWFRLPKDRA